MFFLFTELIALYVEGKKTSSAAASAIVFHINATDKSTVGTVKDMLTEKASGLVTTVEIKDGIRGLSQQLTKKIESLSTSDVAVEIGKNVVMRSCLLLQRSYREKLLFPLPANAVMFLFGTSPI